VALSNVCPHLGCKVHWEEDKRQFFCPCHGGAFNPGGTAIAGPPADEKKDLKKFALKKVGENLFIEIEEIVRL
jgi:cytochrome b6-f complex iron-sulfur subunit